MATQKYKYLYGPVPSRRLGLSLGVDLVPLKTCTYNCIYCQLGSGDLTKPDRSEYVSASSLLDELSDWMKAGGKADYITLTGSGEPTLNSAIGQVITGVKELMDIPVAVITNGSLLSDPETRKDICKADLVMPSLDGGSRDIFEKINRPGNLDFDEMVEGLRLFSNEYKGKLWLEVFLIHDLNTSKEALSDLKSITDTLRMDRLFLNTSVRPPAEEYATAATASELALALGVFGCEAYVIDTFEKHSDNEAGEGSVTEEMVFSLLQRRPCTAKDTVSGLGADAKEVLAILESLRNKGMIEEEIQNGKLFFKAAVPEYGMSGVIKKIIICVLLMGFSAFFMRSHFNVGIVLFVMSMVVAFIILDTRR